MSAAPAPLPPPPHPLTCQPVSPQPESLAARLLPPPPERPLRWLHVDDALIAVDKPAGLLSVPGRGESGADCASAQVQARYPEALIVHRLDMGTSGLLVLARGPAAQRALSQAFEQRRVHKRYEAVVAGLLAEEGGLIDLPLITDWPNRPRQKVCHLSGKPSQTRWQLLQREAVPLRHEGVCVTAGRSRLALFPITGRSHQLRVHLQALGHPILGDELYAPPAVVLAAPRLLLHAAELELPHPLSGTTLSLRCAPEF